MTTARIGRTLTKMRWRIIAQLTAAGVLLAAAVAAATDYVIATDLGAMWPRYLFPQRPQGIVIHHSATGPITDPAKVAEVIDKSHEERGWGVYFAGRVYHIGYHFVVLPDGQIIEGRPTWMPGAHCRGHNNTIGICLVGNFDCHGARPTYEQLRACAGLVKYLLRRHRLSEAKVYLHRELGQTACPGKYFPAKEFRELIEADH
ncbi:MAG: N-acetylmuramoyl-L-alanine amidase [Armatimonadetes bacterium]|nr:N-acetylmuramoyl-L-alanine amidase [Armatimonadota bacterium]